MAKMSITKEQLETLYVKQGLTIRQCTEALGLPTHGAIQWAMKKFGIKARPQLQTDKFHGGGKPPEQCSGWKGGKQVVRCDACGKELQRFPSLIGKHNFCNKACKANWMRQDLIGQKFGMLTVIRKAGRDKHNHILWECLCDCGNTKNINTSNLSIVQSCGCAQFPKGEKNHNWKGGKFEVPCDYCGKKIMVYPSKVTSYEKHFCDATCYGKYITAFELRKGGNSPKYIKRIETECAYCGKPLEITVHKAKLYENHFCKGTDCQAKWNSEYRRGKANGNYRGVTPEMRKIRSRISAAMHKAIKHNKAGRHWEELVDYNLEQLTNRLKSTLPHGYSWKDDFVNGNGILHIDHKIPMSAFNFNSPEHIDFKRCFALDNLQLLPAIENEKKNAKLEKPFQPCLAFG
jgi:hypothetical protein